MVKRHLINIRKPLPKGHVLIPGNLFASQSDEWRRIGDYYASLSVYVFFGRRQDYSGSGDEHRGEFLRTTLDSLLKFTSPMRVNFELLSYDRLVGSISRDEQIKPPHLG